MSQGDSPSVHIDDVGVDAQLVSTCHRLGRKGFVQLHQIEIGDLQTGAGQSLLRGGNRANAHHIGVHSRRG